MNRFLISLKEAIYVQFMLLFLWAIGYLLYLVSDGEANTKSIVVSCSVYAFLFCSFYLANFSDTLRNSSDIKTFFRCFVKNLTFSKL